MRVRVAIIFVGGGSGTEPTVVVRQWRFMVVVAIASLQPPLTMTCDGGGGNNVFG